MSRRISNTIKKLSSVIMVFALLLGMLTVSGNTITAKASQSPVELYSVDGQTIYHGLDQFNVYILIAADSAANKSVVLHYLNDSGVWVDENATFFSNLDSDTEIWKATVSGFALSQFAIKYVGDNTTYWDNNNGNNYIFIRDILGAANVQAVRCSSLSPQYYPIRAAVKNLAYTKVVKVRYTQDNWATYQEAELQYNHSVADSDIEIWNTSLTLDSTKMDSFQYCLCYQVNGQTYWDNNFGANYNTSFFSPY